MEGEAPAKHAAVHSGGEALRSSHTARGAAYPAEGTRSSHDRSAAFPANEEAPIVRPAPPNNIKAAGKPLPDENAGEK
jgi:hypothetical protein